MKSHLLLSLYSSHNSLFHLRFKFWFPNFSQVCLVILRVNLEIRRANLVILGANLVILGANLVTLRVNLEILGANLVILCVNINYFNIIPLLFLQVVSLNLDIIYKINFCHECFIRLILRVINYPDVQFIIPVLFQQANIYLVFCLYFFNFCQVCFISLIRCVINYLDL